MPIQSSDSSVEWTERVRWFFVYAWAQLGRDSPAQLPPDRLLGVWQRECGVRYPKDQQRSP
jgi:hypothetical protein